jgi:hypothetical protein
LPESCVHLGGLKSVNVQNKKLYTYCLQWVVKIDVS